MKLLLLALSILVFSNAFAGKITGTVTNDRGIPLGFASISIKGTNHGAIANAQGRYEINVAAGNYTLVCQHVGFRAESKTITLADAIEVHFILQPQQLTMEEVVVRGGPDPAIEIIRKTIAKRNFYNKQVDTFSVDVYIKGALKTRHIPEKFIRKNTSKEEMESTGFDSLGRGTLFLSESQTKVSYKRPDTYKYEVISSRQAGGGYGISFPFFINFYTNNVNVFENLNPRGFVSPIADNAFHYYKFRYEGSFFENGRMIDRIKVTPKRKNEPLFQGYVQIVDGEWRIHSFDLLTTKDYQLQLIDTVRLTQLHAPVTEDVWRTQNQVVYLAANTLGFEWTGNFLNVYTNYDLDPGFGKKHFTRTIMSYDTAFNKKDSLYWERTRPIPLEAEERRDFVFKDSLYKKIRDSFFTQNNIDSLNRRKRPIGFNDIMITGIKRNFYSKKGVTTYQLTPLIFALQYNTVEGFVPDLTHTLLVNPKKGSNNYQFDVNTRYGFSNRHFNAFGRVVISPEQNYLDKSFEFSGGKRVSQFNPENPINSLMNTSYTLFRRKNFMKIYENWFGNLTMKSGLEAGLRWKVSATYEDRMPLVNTTDYSMYKRSRVFLPNHPFELAHIPFNRHQALVTSVQLTFQPGQRYIQFPTAKVPVGSDKPVFDLQYAKGVKKLLGSDVDFDRWKFTILHKVNLKLKGEFHYRVGVGGFLNDAQVEIPDFQHFNGNQVFAAQQYLNSFQLAPYYRYSNTEKLYGLLHAEHHFNGLLTNKIPLFNKLKWTLVAGANTFYVNRDNYYVEAFAGIENILKIFRIDFIAGYQAQPGNSFGVRLGMGGLIGSALNASIKNK